MGSASGRSGVTTARNLARHYRLEELKDASAESLCELRDIGPVVADNIVRFLGDEHNRSIIDKLLAAGVRWEPMQVQQAADLQGKTFVITGALPLGRDAIKERLVSRGAKVSGSVSGRTDYLVVGENPGSKLDKARRLDVPILDAAELMELLGKPG